MKPTPPMPTLHPLTAPEVPLLHSQANVSAAPMAVDAEGGSSAEDVVVAGTSMLAPEAMDTAEGDSASQVSVFGKRTERDL